MKSVEKATLELEQARLKRPVIDIELSASVTDAYVGDYSAQPPQLRPKRFVLVSATVTNRGNLHAVLDLSSDSLFVIRMDSASGGDGRIQFSAGRKSYRVVGVTADTAGILLLPGNKQVLQYMVEVNRGMYLVEFRIPAHTEAFAQYKADGYEEGKQISDEDRKRQRTWSSSTFVNVFPTVNHKP